MGVVDAAVQHRNGDAGTIEAEALKKETDPGSAKRLEKVNQEIADLGVERDEMKKRWREEKDIIESVRATKEQIDQLKALMESQAAVPPDAPESRVAAFHHDVGDLGEEWTYDRLNRAFRALQAGAALVAIQKNRFWDPGGGLCLDAGAFVAALEYASEQDAVLVGKPSTPFFVTAAEYLGIPRDRVAIVGDSVPNDVEGGQRAGCLGVAVRTGTFREEDLENLERPPDAVLDSIASLPDWLGLQ